MWIGIRNLKDREYGVRAKESITNLWKWRTDIGIWAALIGKWSTSKDEWAIIGRNTNFKGRW